MTDLGNFVTREERDAFHEFRDADRGNFELGIDDRLATAWAAARDYWQGQGQGLSPELPRLVDNPRHLGLRLVDEPGQLRVSENVQADTKPELQLVESMSLEEAVGVTLGFASACWDNLRGAGVFESERAEQASQELVRYLREGWHLEPKSDGVDRDVYVKSEGFSEFGRGYEEGKAEASDRVLRITALGHAVDLAKMGNIQLKGTDGATISFGDPLEVAKAYFTFLQGGE